MTQSIEKRGHCQRKQQTMMFRSFRLGRFAPHHVICCRTHDGRIYLSDAGQTGCNGKILRARPFPRAVLLDGKSCANANCFVEFFEK